MVVAAEVRVTFARVIAGARAAWFAGVTGHERAAVRPFAQRTWPVALAGVLVLPVALDRVAARLPEKYGWGVRSHGMGMLVGAATSPLGRAYLTECAGAMRAWITARAARRAGA